MFTFILQSSQSHDYPIMKKKNLLADEDEVDFISCCDADTFKFVATPKKYKINILVHALVSGPMCGLGLWYLLPTTLNNLFYNNTGTRIKVGSHVVILYLLLNKFICRDIKVSHTEYYPMLYVQILFKNIILDKL